jgi:AhpD family alkylhydroperoxidase
VTTRLDYKAQAPRLAAAMNRLDGTVELGPPLRELVNLRASQINGCAYCIDMHTKDARAASETEQRL